MSDQPSEPGSIIPAEPVVAEAEEKGMDEEAYNTINAPQFLDFSKIDAAEADDADADKFFGMSNVVQN
jgi:hypothetical protein